MKHKTAHKILLTAALAALCALSAARPASAQEAPPDPEETITVSTRVVRISVSVQSRRAPARWEVRDNSLPQGDVVVDAPADSNPLSLVVVLDLAEDRAREWKYYPVERRLSKLASRLRLKNAPRVFVAGPAAARFPFHWPAQWPVTYLPGIKEALARAMDAVERGEGGSRRALLLLTNRMEELPALAFEGAEARLASTAAYIYFMAVVPQPRLRPGDPGRVVARTNLNDGRVQTTGDKFVDSQFDQFERIGNSLFVVAYPLRDEAAGAQAPARSVEVKAIGAGGEILAFQRREYHLSP